MPFEQTESLWLHQHYTFSLSQLAELAGLTEGELHEMVEDGILAPIDPGSEPWTFGADRLVRLRMAKRLIRDFDLDTNGLALVITLLDRVHALEAEVSELRARLPCAVR